MIRDYSEFVDIIKQVVPIMEEHSDPCVLLAENGWWQIWNGSGSISGQIQEDLSFMVKAADFISAYQIFVNRGYPVKISIEGNVLNFRGGRLTTKVTLLAETISKPPEIWKADGVVPITKEIKEAFFDCTEFCGSDPSDTIFSSVHITKDFIEASNRVSWIRFAIKQNLPCLLLTNKAARILTKCDAPQIGVANNGEILYVVSTHLEANLPLFTVEYPCLPENLLDIDNAGKLEIPLPPFKEAVELATKISKQPSTAFLVLENAGNFLKTVCETEANETEEKIRGASLPEKLNIKTFLTPLTYILRKTIGDFLILHHIQGKCILWKSKNILLISGIQERE